MLLMVLLLMSLQIGVFWVGQNLFASKLVSLDDIILKLLLGLWLFSCVALLTLLSWMLEKWLLNPVQVITKHLQLLLEDATYNQALQVLASGPLEQIAGDLSKLLQKHSERNGIAIKQAYNKGAAELGALLLADIQEVVQPLDAAVLTVEQQLKELPVTELDMLGVGRRIRERQRAAIVKISGIRSRLSRIITVVRQHTLQFNIK